jgi:hypothetical protein
MTSEEIVRGRWHYLRIVMQYSTVCIFAAEFALLKVLSNEIDLAESGISRKDRLHELPHHGFIIPTAHS